MFSVVLPTHNRLSLLRDAIESVRSQDYQDWELVIFDNASEENIGAYVRKLKDRRIRCVRSNTFLPVTESWNNAIDLAQGDYVTLLGDDDGLAPEYFSKLHKLADKFKNPEVFFSAIYQFIHPGVMRSEWPGYVANVRNGFFFGEKKEPFVLDIQSRLEGIRGSVGLHRKFTFNMQGFVFHRKFLAKLRADGSVFRSPFPDYYLANVAFALAERVVIVPEALAIAGVSKASFGFTLFNGLDDNGAALLNNNLNADPVFNRIAKKLLPGSYYLTNYMITMQYFHDYCGKILKCRVNFGRYRRLTIYDRVKRFGGGLGRASVDWSAFWTALSVPEKVFALFLRFGLPVTSRFRKFHGRIVLPILEWLTCPTLYKAENRFINRGGFQNLIDVYRALQKKSFSNGELIPLKKKAFQPEKFSPPKKSKIAVVYLARAAEGIEPIRNFIRSYEKNKAGCKHDLIVIFKGYTDNAAVQQVRNLLRAIPFTELRFSDEGFDINAYQKAAYRIDHDYVCFLNTFAELTSNNWLKYLARGVKRPGVGLAGAMASFESLFDSTELYTKVIWLCNHMGISYDDNFFQTFSFIIEKFCKSWLKRHHRFSVSDLRSLWNKLFAGRDDPYYTEKFDALWKRLVNSVPTYMAYAEFPPFPNPHIRSNCFMLSRKLFLSLFEVPIVTKLDSCMFESGIRGMTAQISNLGLYSVIVDKTGKVFKLDQAPKSKTFRLGNQDNLMVTDNQTRSFERMNSNSRKMHTLMSWGPYADIDVTDIPDIGIAFDRKLPR